jgi:hypothetical protein
MIYHSLVSPEVCLQFRVNAALVSGRSVFLEALGAQLLIVGLLGKVAQILLGGCLRGIGLCI